MADASVRSLYPLPPRTAGASVRRGLSLDAPGELPLPDPTTAAPGTSEKIAILEMRAKLKLALWYPADAWFEGDPRALAAVLVGRRAADPQLLAGC